MVYLFLLLGSLANAIGSLLLKATLSNEAITLAGRLWPFIISILFLVGGLVGYTLALRSLPLPVIYPLYVTGTLLIIVVVTSRLERITIEPPQLIGMGLSLVAIYLLTRGLR